jgi:uncharacterized peroxidase-related enzyme
MSDARPRFTTDVLEWSAWLAPVDVAAATPDQLATLEESGPHARTSQYYHLLLHDAAALRRRSLLFNAIIYGPKGLPRADRELGAAVESIENGCVYCTSVHARFYLQLTKRADVIEALFDKGVAAPLPPRERAIADFAAALARRLPARMQATFRPYANTACRTKRSSISPTRSRCSPGPTVLC